MDAADTRPRFRSFTVRTLAELEDDAKSIALDFVARDPVPLGSTGFVERRRQLFRHSPANVWFLYGEADCPLAYWSCFPLTETAYYGILDGKRDPELLAPSDLIKLVRPGFSHWLFLHFHATRSGNGAGIVRALFRAMISRIACLAPSGSVVRHVVVRARTEEARMLCDGIGMKADSYGPFAILHESETHYLYALDILFDRDNLLLCAAKDVRSFYDANARRLGAENLRAVQHVAFADSACGREAVLLELLDDSLDLTSGPNAQTCMLALETICGFHNSAGGVLRIEFRRGRIAIQQWRRHFDRFLGRWNRPFVQWRPFAVSDDALLVIRCRLAPWPVFLTTNQSRRYILRSGSRNLVLSEGIPSERVMGMPDRKGAMRRSPELGQAWRSAEEPGRNSHKE